MANASTYLNKTFSTGDNRKKWTWSAWIKRSNLSSDNWLFNAWVDSSNENSIFFDTSDRFGFSIYEGATNNNGRLTTTRKFRDTSAWYHIQCVWDSANATATDRMIIYVNGERETAFDTQINATLNYDSLINSNNVHYIGQYGLGSPSMRFSGLITHMHFIDGTAYPASTFGETDANGVWKPITDPSVTYGTNGFFLKFENSSNMDLDSSPNNHTFTTSGSLTQTIDSPSNVYAVLNVLNPQASGYTIANGNLSVTTNAGDAWRTTYSTIGASSGKWYWEQKITNFTGVDPHYIGIVSEDQMSSSNIDQASTTRGYFYTATGAKRTNNAQVSYGDSWTTGDIVGVAMDLDNNKLYFSKNGVWQNSGDPTSGATGTGSAFDITSGYVYLASTSTYYSSNTYQMNFGNGFFGTTAVSSAGLNGNGSIFEYDCPTGYYALNTKNLATYG